MQRYTEVPIKIQKVDDIFGLSDNILSTKNYTDAPAELTIVFFYKEIFSVDTISIGITLIEILKRSIHGIRIIPKTLPTFFKTDRNINDSKMSGQFHQPLTFLFFESRSVLHINQIDTKEHMFSEINK